MISNPTIKWPEGKRFAFTIFDDTDFATLKRIQPVYALLHDLGFRTTKSIWPVRGDGQPICGGSTCEDARYLKWALRLQSAGFEAGYHLTTFHSSNREQIIDGFTKFEDRLGTAPMTMANHFGCNEAIYWGSNRLTGPNRALYNLLTRFHRKEISFGHVEGSDHFWGDVCKARIKFVRNFVFREINTLKACPMMPYHDALRPYARNWFASSEGPEVRSFCRTINEAAQDRLEEEGGACIMYSHLASGFYKDGAIDPQFKRLMQRLSRKQGWFVPVSTLLEFLLKEKGSHEISETERNNMERRWLWEKCRRGTT
jgi:hypothetical protein